MAKEKPQNTIHPIEAIPLIKTYLWQLQHTICQAFETVEQGKSFQAQPWESSLGHGISQIFEQGAVFEKAGVNVSHVKASQLPAAAIEMRPDIKGHPFEAIGLSLVVHPVNPYVPTTHANFRFIMTQHPTAPSHWWFGGGFDLTPYYGFKEDCQHWHQTAKNACDPFGSHLYPRFKTWCDDYFYLPHRQEARGIGGLFFDDFQEAGFDHCFQFMQNLGDHFLQAYLPIVRKRQDIAYGHREKDFQRYRRGRYVEFNLLYDRGTLFGLQSKGRTESILMSLPPDVIWRYDWQPEPGCPEAALYTDFLPSKDWI